MSAVGALDEPRVRLAPAAGTSGNILAKSAGGDHALSWTPPVAYGYAGWQVGAPRLQLYDNRTGQAAPGDYTSINAGTWFVPVWIPCPVNAQFFGCYVYSSPTSTSVGLWTSGVTGKPAVLLTSGSNTSASPGQMGVGGGWTLAMGCYWISISAGGTTGIYHLPNARVWSPVPFNAAAPSNSSTAMSTCYFNSYAGVATGLGSDPATTASNMGNGLTPFVFVQST
jgi:hypothetical protein